MAAIMPGSEPMTKRPRLLWRVGISGHDARVIVAYCGRRAGAQPDLDAVAAYFRPLKSREGP